LRKGTHPELVCSVVSRPVRAAHQMPVSLSQTAQRRPHMASRAMRLR
jgi:hypothetical protein